MCTIFITLTTLWCPKLFRHNDVRANLIFEYMVIADYCIYRVYVLAYLYYKDFCVSSKLTIFGINSHTDCR